MICNDTSQLSLFIDSILVLISPLLSSSYTLIPNLKENYLDYLDAPIPFLVGITDISQVPKSILQDKIILYLGKFFFPKNGIFKNY